MISTGIDTRIKVQQIIENQLPEFILSESPKAVDFLKQYYISQEYTGGPIDLTDNLDQYLKLDNLTPETLKGSVTLDADNIKIGCTEIGTKTASLVITSDSGDSAAVTQDWSLDYKAEVVGSPTIYVKGTTDTTAFYNNPIFEITAQIKGTYNSSGTTYINCTNLQHTK